VVDAQVKKVRRSIDGGGAEGGDGGNGYGEEEKQEDETVVDP